MTRHFVEVGGNIRPKIESLIEALVDILDQIDGDADNEDGCDVEDGADNEPSLGAVQARNQTYWADGGTDDREQETEHDEPSLGAIESLSGGSQERWADSGTDDREPDTDFELDHAERGLCDEYALAEFYEEQMAMDRVKRNLFVKQTDRRRYAAGGFHRGTIRFPKKERGNQWPP